TDVGRLFIAGIIPGILATFMYMATVIVAHRKGLPAGKKFDAREAFASLLPIWAVVVLFVAIIGTIYLGIATPTEAAALGAFLTMLIGILRNRLNPQQILTCLVESLRTTVAIFTVLIGAVLF